MADADDGRERRRSERVPVNAEFRTMPQMVFVSDLSEQGVFVHTEQLVALGTVVQVRFTVLLDDPVVIAARGRVVRHQHDPSGVGIEFTRLDPEMVLRIGDIVSQQRPRDLLVQSSPSEAPRRTTLPPAPPAGGDTRVTRPPAAPVAAAAPEPEEFDANQTLVKLQAVDVEILDDDDEFDHDPSSSSPRGRRR